MNKYYVLTKFNDGTWAETSKGKEIVAQSEGEALNIFIGKLQDTQPTFMSDNAYIVKSKVERVPTQEEAINNRVNELTHQLHELDDIVTHMECKLFWSDLRGMVALTLGIVSVITLVYLGA